MNDDWISHRNIVVTDEASKSIKKFTKTYRRFAKQWDGLKWLLSEKPENSSPKRLDDSGRVFYVMRDYGDPSCDLVAISVVYTYDEKEVTILGVTAWEPSE